jgi:symplekin
MEAVNGCFASRSMFTAEVLAVVMNQLAEQTPLPLLLMRTLIQTVTAAPKLKPRVVETLSKLVQKQVGDREDGVR